MSITLTSSAGSGTAPGVAPGAGSSAGSATLRPAVAGAPRLLRLTLVAMVVLAAVSAVGLVVDDRTLLGDPIWLKPLKFSVSIAVYGATVAWLVSLLPASSRGARRLTALIAVTMLVEATAIVVQVIRGRRSHFDVATPFDALVFSTMGVVIAVAWVATAGLGLLLLRQALPDAATATAVRTGTAVALAGMAVGFLMTRPTPGQLAGGPPTTVGAHSVGVPDGGPGLPLVGWSTTGGDLRIAHFVGLHTLQLLPLVAFALARTARRWPALRPAPVRVRLIRVAAAGQAGLVVLLTWQALRAQALLRPDAVTLVAAAGLALGIGAATLAVVAAATRSPSPQLR